MNLKSKIYIAGHRGLVGLALLRRLAASGVRRAHLHSTMRIAKWSLTPFFAHTSGCLEVCLRWLKQLKENDEIEFRGAPKTGGYFAK